MPENHQAHVDFYDQEIRNPDLEYFARYSGPIIPGMDQSPDYTQAVLEACNRLADEPFWGGRIRNTWREALAANSVTVESFMDEEALDRQFGTEQVMQGALQHLVQIAKVTGSIRILPRRLPPEHQVNATGSGIGNYGISKRRDQATPIVWPRECEDAVTAGHPQYERIMRFHEQLGRSALSPEDSLALISHYADTWR